MPRIPPYILVRTHLSAAAGFVVPFVLVVYLAVQAGGYDLVVRSQVGILVWWVILLGVIAGLLPVTRITKLGWMCLAVLAMLSAWTAIGTFTWTESTERSMVELSRVLTLSGVLMLLLMVQGRDGLRRSVSALGAAVAVIAALALASKFHPDWFHTSGIPQSFPLSRLNYPLEYWNGLAALLAIGIAPLLWIVTCGRSLPGRALAAGSIPIVILAGYLTASRGGAVEALMALVILFVLFPKRILLALNAFIPTVGSVALILLINRRPELRDHELGPISTSQGAEMLWITLAVFLLAGLSHWLFTTALERRSFPVPEMSQDASRRTGIALAVVSLLVLTTAVGSGFVGERWSEFQDTANTGSTVSRLGTLNSGERYLVWDAAVEASSSERLTGIGPGTFEYWYNQEGRGVQFVRDAHSLYLEALAEMGPMGLLLVVLIVLLPICSAVTRAVRPGSIERRGLLAAAASGMTAFAVGAGIDWAWEMTVLPVMFLLLVAASAGPSSFSRKGLQRSRFDALPFGWRTRVSVAFAAALAFLVISIPLIATILIRESQNSFQAGNERRALSEAEDAVVVQPYSASGEMQVALLRERTGDERGALSSARNATKDEPTNWRTWFVLGQVSEMTGKYRLADAAFRNARSLNQRSSLSRIAAADRD